MPNPATPKLRDLAQRLLACETIAGPSADGTAPAAFSVCHKLRRPLSTLAGAAGFRSLLRRALTLAKQEIPALNAMQVTPEGSLDFLGEGRSNPDDVTQGGIVLIAQLLGLLVIFIGESLTLRLLQETWPDVVDDHDLKERDNHA
jgi:hypothetical protein